MPLSLPYTDGLDINDALDVSLKLLDLVAKDGIPLSLNDACIVAKCIEEAINSVYMP